MNSNIFFFHMVLNRILHKLLKGDITRIRAFIDAVSSSHCHMVFEQDFIYNNKGIFNKTYGSH